jgi:pimeloyl-ACP methyl ester carboxylesterase
MKNNTWIILRGLGREKGHWGPFAGRFHDAFPEDEILYVDLPGTGEFRGTASPANVAGIFQFVRGKAIERAKAQASFKLVAVSLGAMVAMEWLKQKPDDLAGAVLINTSLKSLSPMYHRLRWQIWMKFLKLVTEQVPREREREIIDLLINSEEARAKALPLWTKLATDHPVSYRTMFNQLLAGSRFEGLNQPVNVPVLLLNSLGDRFVDPSCSAALHRKYGWPLERHAWAGHDLPWDDPEWCVAKIKAWDSSSFVKDPL